MPTFIGIDPGLGGAVAILQEGHDPVIVDTPTVRPKGKKENYDIPMMAALLRKYAGEGAIAVMELVHAMPRNGGVSMFNFGRGNGIWEGILATCNYEVHMVTPQTWKSGYEELSPVKEPRGKKAKKEKVKLTKAERKEQDRQKRLAKAAAKAKARELAGKMYPSIAHLFAQVNSDGRAEALLMACYGRNHINRS